jgi:hypothetical protein
MKILKMRGKTNDWLKEEDIFKKIEIKRKILEI